MADYQYQQELDSNDARADFENVLQGMLDKANAGERLVFTSVFSISIEVLAAVL